MSAASDPVVQQALAALFGPRQLKLEELSETQFDALLFGGNKGMATRLGWDSFHALKMRGSKPGYPDRTAWRERHIFVEEKVGKNKPSEAQVGILEGLSRSGGEVYLWRPADYQDAGEILGRRWTFTPWRSESDLPHLARFGSGAWVPGSLWLPGVGRADSHPDYDAFAGAPAT